MNKPLQGLILSDLHLTNPKAELSKFGLEDAINGIKEIKKLCTLRKTQQGGSPRAPAAPPPAPFDFFVIAGDIFDSVSVNPSSIHLACLLRDALSDIPEGYIIRGNHDRADYNMLEDMFGWTQLYSDKVSYVRNSEITISGINYSSDDDHRKYLQAAPSDIMVLHASMKPFGGFTEGCLSAAECPKDRVVIVGDTHVSGVYLQDDRCVLSPGNLFPLNKSEITSGNSGSCFILTISKSDGELDVDMSPVRFTVRKALSLMDIASPEELIGNKDLNELLINSKDSLTPVVYVRRELVDYVPDGLIAVGRSVAEDLSADISSVSSADDGGDALTRFQTLLSGFFSQDDRQEDLVRLSLDLITSEDSDRVISDFLK